MVGREDASERRAGSDNGDITWHMQVVVHHAYCDVHCTIWTEIVQLPYNVVVGNDCTNAAIDGV